MPNGLWACVLLLRSGCLCVRCCWLAVWTANWPAGWTADCQWSCNSCLISVGQGLVRHCHCVSHIALHITVVPSSSGFLMFLQSVIQLQIHALKFTVAQLAHQCLITFPDFAFPAQTKLTLSVTACSVCGGSKCSSVSQQLFREVRIMKILNHPNIGRTWWLQSSSFLDITVSNTQGNFLKAAVCDVSWLIYCFLN